MNLPLLQVAIITALIAYAIIWRRQQSKRGSRSWNEIVSKLRENDWGMEKISERYLYKSGIRATTEDIWQRIAGCRGLLAMYKNAPVLVELADYASEHSEFVDKALLEELRRDAFQIRLHVMLALMQHVVSSSSAGASVNAHSAAQTYSAMLAMVTGFIQEHSARLFPSYLDAIA